MINTELAQALARFGWHAHAQNVPMTTMMRDLQEFLAPAYGVDLLDDMQLLERINLALYSPTRRTF